MQFFKNISVKTLTLAMLCGFVTAVLLSFAGFQAKCNVLRQNVLRLHILANSNSAADQALKLTMRDRLLKETAGLFETAQSKDQALQKAQQFLPQLKQLAEDELRRHGCNDPVTVELGKSEFNTRHYTGFSLPAGEYDAVRVLIGNAEGKNWWCVLFPALCVPAATENKGLEQAVPKKAAEIAEQPQHYKIAFKSAELYEEVKVKIQKIFKNENK